jgi:hypothetical protein
MLTTDQQLTLTYKQMFGLNNIDNTLGNTTFQGNIYVTNKLDVFGNSLILNDTSCNSFLSVNGNSNIFNNDATVNSIINISGATTLNGNVSIGSNLSISGNSTIYGLTSVSNKTMFFNTFTVGSNLYVGGAIRFGSNFKCNTIRSIDNTPDNTDLNIIADKIHIGTTNSNIYIQGTTVNLITENLDIQDNLVTLNIDPNTANAFDDGSLAGIQIQSNNNNIGYIRVTEDGLRYEIKAPQDNLSWYIATTDSDNNLNVSGSSILNNSVTISSLMYVSGNTILQGNTTLNSSLNVSGNSLIQGATTITGNLYISGGTLLQGYTTINSTLTVNNNLIINGASTINSLLYISGNTNINGQLTISSVLNVNGNTLILGNITINSQLSVSNNTIIEGDSTVLACINISGNANLHNTNIYGSILVSGNTIFNSATTINSQLVVNGTSYLNNNITIGSNLDIIGNIISNIPEYPDNLTAKNAGIAIWEFYRTGGIIKIRLNDQPPIITLLGNTTESISLGNTYTDPGAYALDFAGNQNIIYITSLAISGTNNLLSDNILITGTSTLISQTSTLSSGSYIITYQATDSSGNIGFNYRLLTINNPMVSVQLNTSPQSLQYFTRLFTPNNSKKWTLSYWTYSTSMLNGQGAIFYSSSHTAIAFNHGGNLRTWLAEANPYIQLLNTLIPSLNTWTNVVITYDSTLSDSSKRYMCYYNNVLMTSTGSASSNNLPLDYVIGHFANQNTWYIGNRILNDSQFQGYLSQFIFVDNQALTPSSFGYLNSNNNWTATPYSGTFGPNGFYLTFNDSSNVGLDSSGNNNNWISNGIDGSNIVSTNNIPQ